MKNSKYIFITIIGTIIITGIVFYNMNIFATPYYNDRKNEGDDIVLTVNYNNGSIKYIENIMVVSENNTVFDVLLVYCTIGYTEYAGGVVFIDSIDGVENQAPNWWQYWVNGLYASVAASNYHLNEADEIEWTFGNS